MVHLGDVVLPVNETTPEYYFVLGIIAAAEATSRRYNRSLRKWPHSTTAAVYSVVD